MHLRSSYGLAFEIVCFAIWFCACCLTRCLLLCIANSQIVTDRRSRMADQRSIHEQMAEIVGDLEQVAALTQEAADAETPADAVPNREMASLVRDANEMAALARAAEAGLLPEQDPSGQDPVDHPRPDPHNYPMQRQIQARSVEQVRFPDEGRTDWQNMDRIFGRKRAKRLHKCRIDIEE